MPHRLAASFLTVACLLAVAASEARAQHAREELALGLLRFEYALRDAPLTGSAIPQVNRAFDRLTLAFFAGRTAQALGSLDSLTAARPLTPDRRSRHTSDAVAALRDATARVEALEVGDHAFRVMMHVPEGVTGPRPLLVALHGAGGDERMFFTAYGAGILREIADRVGAVAVTPSTMQLGMRAEQFAAMLDVIAARTPIDRARVYVLGHSMGAGITARLVSLHPRQISAVACIAGPCGAPVPGDPPRLIVSGALDPLSPPARLRPPAGTDPALVSYHEVADWGHTLLVGHVLDDTVRWLLSHRTAGSSPE